MIETIKGIRTAEGVAQIDYDALSNKPVIINPNLLDNWYFGNPVNQRGLTIHTNINGNTQYYIDRWKGRTGTHIVTVTGDALKIENQSTAYSTYFEQAFEYPLNLQSAVTLTVLVKSLLGNNAYAQPIYKDNSYGSAIALKEGLNSKTYKDNKEISRVLIQIDKGATLEIKAVKLELGDTQTLAHQDADGNWVLNEIPNYAEELAKCQRYFQIFRTETERKTYCEDFRPTMRVTDNGEVAKSTLTINGVTYYTATADL